MLMWASLLVFAFSRCIVRADVCVYSTSLQQVLGVSAVQSGPESTVIYSTHNPTVLRELAEVKAGSTSFLHRASVHNLSDNNSYGFLVFHYTVLLATQHFVQTNMKILFSCDVTNNVVFLSLSPCRNAPGWLHADTPNLLGPRQVPAGLASAVSFPFARAISVKWTPLNLLKSPLDDYNPVLVWVEPVPGIIIVLLKG